ncbi:MAG: cytochrome c-type biogenesis protein [Paracoccaceae bacterium]|jgi:cytochrome c-type biogenesis protein CcmH
MKRLLLILALIWSVPAFAVEPDEMLKDPALEARARDISEGLRCLVCRNETIDESNASLAKDLRLLVRERLKAGDTDEEVVQFIVDRYGEYVLLNPTTKGANIILWIAGPAMLLIALGIGAVYIRGRRRAAEEPREALSEAEAARLKEIMGE